MLLSYSALIINGYEHLLLEFSNINIYLLQSCLNFALIPIGLSLVKSRFGIKYRRYLQLSVRVTCFFHLQFTGESVGKSNFENVINSLMRHSFLLKTCHTQISFQCYNYYLAKDFLHNNQFSKSYSFTVFRIKK